MLKITDRKNNRSVVSLLLRLEFVFILVLIQDVIAVNRVGHFLKTSRAAKLSQPIIWVLYVFIYNRFLCFIS